MMNVQLHQYQILNLEKIDPYDLYLFDDIE